MTPEELQNAREVRQFRERIIILLLAAIPSWFGMVMQWRSADRQLETQTTLHRANEDRVRIEDKVDKAAVAATVAAIKSEEIKTATEEVKTAVQSAKDEIKSGMDK